MQKFIALFAFIAVIGVVCSVDPVPVDPVLIPIVKSDSHVNDDGSYSFMYEGGNGNFREETGEIVNPGTEDEFVKVSGSYKYIDANGEEVVVQYTADENGFVPVGTGIPQEISNAALAAKDLPKPVEEKKPK